MSIRILLAGESWVSNATHFKGWDFFSSTVYETGISYFQAAVEAAGMQFTHMPSHLAAEQFPASLEALAAYDVVILSDIGANTLLLHPDTWLRGKSSPNRLRVLADWVNAGGALAMCGGYYSFAGVNAAAKYYRTVIEDILPVNIHTFDDRIEAPEGATAEVIEAAHPILAGMPREWPALLGFNETVPKADASVLAKVNGYPLLATRDVGKGRTLVWTSDIGPHWCPAPFASWEGYARLWQQAMQWLAPQESAK